MKFLDNPGVALAYLGATGRTRSDASALDGGPTRGFDPTDPTGPTQPFPGPFPGPGDGGRGFGGCTEKAKKVALDAAAAGCSMAEAECETGFACSVSWDDKNCKANWTSTCEKEKEKRTEPA